MKFFFHSLLLCLSLCSAVAPAQISRPGGIETNGGNAIAAEFFNILDSVLFDLKSKILPTNETEVLHQLVAKRFVITVRSESQVYLNDIEVSAINQPTLNLIIVSETSWNKLNFEQKKLLVLHETLPVASYADKNYWLSSWLLELSKGKDNDVILVQDLIGMCQPFRIATFDINLLKNRQDLNHLLHIAALRGCHAFITKAAQANWDLNYCWEGLTAYQRLVKTAQVSLPEEIVQRVQTAELLLQLGSDITKKCQ